MSTDSWAGLSPSERNTAFADALEHVDDAIQTREIARMSAYRTMFQRGSYTLGQGLVKQLWRFHPGVGDQAGMQRWRPIQVSQAATSSAPGVDACNYNPFTVNYGFERISYTGFQTERDTDPICIRDIRFLWEFKQQLEKIYSYLGDITNSVWENWNREMYIKFAADNSNTLVLSGGTPQDNTFTYDPFAVDSNGLNEITISAGIDVSTLQWKPLRRLNRHLSIQAPGGKLASDGNGKSVYGLVIDMEDWQQMIEDDPDLREDFHHAMPQVLIQNFGSIETYKGYSMIHDDFAPRFAIKSQDGTDITLNRVLPFDDTTAVTIGTRANIQQEYLDAEFGLGVLLIKDVFMTEVPPAGPTNPGGGTNFGATPSLNGEWHWINEFDKETNILKENGFYFGRFEGFPKPMGLEQEAIVFLYRRCPAITPTECDIGGDDQAALSTAVALAATPAAGDIDTTNNTIILRLADYLGCEPPAAVTLTEDAGAGATTFAGIIADASNAPTYKFALTTSPGAAANWTHTDGPTVQCT